MGISAGRETGTSDLPRGREATEGSEAGLYGHRLKEVVASAEGESVCAHFWALVGRDHDDPSVARTRLTSAHAT
jgi:hypothetical protein